MKEEFADQSNNANKVGKKLFDPGGHGVWSTVLCQEPFPYWKYAS